MTQTHQSPKLHKFRVSYSNDFTLGTASPPVRDCGKFATKIKRNRKFLGLTWYEWISVETDSALIERIQGDLGRLDFETMSDLFRAYESQLEKYYSDGETEKAQQIEKNLLKIVDRIESAPCAKVDTFMGLSDATIYHTNGQQESFIENSQQNQGFQKRAKRGSKGITSAAKRQIKSCGKLLEEQVQRSNLAFVTLTLPALDESQMRQVCDEWSEITRQFCQSLTRVLARKNLSTDYVQVTEIQENRFQKWGQVCPHLHIVFQSRSHRREPWKVSKDDIRFIWQRTLENILGVRLDCRYATRIESPRKSLSKELGKYLSKGGKVVRAIVDRGLGELLPSAWHGESKALKHLERSKRVERVGEVATWFLRRLETLSEAGDIAFRRIYARFKCPTTGIEREICVGAVGWFNSREAVNRVLNMQEAVRKTA